MGYYEDEFAKDGDLSSYSDTIRNKEPLNKLYDELLSILDNKKPFKLRPEIWEKMINENDYRRKAALVNKFWDVFDTPSDDPNIDHKYNRDYLWDKMFQAQPNDLPHYDHPDPTPMYDDFNGWNPIGIANPTDYMSIVQEDTDNDGDIDKVSIEEKNEEDQI